MGTDKCVLNLSGNITDKRLIKNITLLTITNAPIGTFLSHSVMTIQIQFRVAMDTLGKILHGKRLILTITTVLISNNLKLVTKMAGIPIMEMHNVSHYLSPPFLASGVLTSFQRPRIQN